MMNDRILHIAFAPWMVAGVRTQWENMRPYVLKRPDIHAYEAPIEPYKLGGRIEQLPLLPSSIKGNIRSMMCTRNLFSFPRLDAVWITGREMLPYALTKGLLQHTSIVSTTDATTVLQAEFGEHYTAPSSHSMRGRVSHALSTFCMSLSTILNPWSEWAARSMRDDYYVPAHKIHVIPPGIDLRRWPLLARYHGTNNLVRLLFVGGDFHRKGGDLLLDVFNRTLRGRCELHLVTHSELPAQPGVFVYRDFNPNDPGLRDLYAYCDAFVLPTRADCFSMASLEAMATGLPVITSSVGGIPEIVVDGQSGFLIAPDDGAALARRIQMLIESPEKRTAMGTKGREIVERRFDAAHNTNRLIDLIVETCHRRRPRHAV